MSLFDYAHGTIATEPNNRTAERLGHRRRRLGFPLTSDQLLASVVQFLIEGGEEDAANIVLSCDMELAWFEGSLSDYVPNHFTVYFVGPRIAYEQLLGTTEVRQQVLGALFAVCPPDWDFSEMTAQAKPVTSLDPNWHQELLEIARGKDVHNQAVGASNARTWNRLRFRSATEIQIAQALDRTGVLFFPLPLARLTGERGRLSREPDFLVCDDGRWGILEVDGEPYHPPERSALEHQRDRLFMNHGVRVVQRFDATDCFATPDKVVADFRQILRRAYP